MDAVSISPGMIAALEHDQPLSRRHADLIREALAAGRTREQISTALGREWHVCLSCLIRFYGTSPWPSER